MTTSSTSSNTINDNVSECAKSNQNRVKYQYIQILLVPLLNGNNTLINVQSIQIIIWSYSYSQALGSYWHDSFAKKKVLLPTAATLANVITNLVIIFRMCQHNKITHVISIMCS